MVAGGSAAGSAAAGDGVGAAPPPDSDRARSSCSAGPNEREATLHRARASLRSNIGAPPLNRRGKTGKTRRRAARRRRHGQSWALTVVVSVWTLMDLLAASPAWLGAALVLLLLLATVAAVRRKRSGKVARPWTAARRQADLSDSPLCSPLQSPRCQPCTLHLPRDLLLAARCRVAAIAPRAHGGAVGGC